MPDLFQLYTTQKKHKKMIMVLALPISNKQGSKWNFLGGRCLYVGSEIPKEGGRIFVPHITWRVSREGGGIYWKLKTSAWNLHQREVWFAYRTPTQSCTRTVGKTTRQRAANSRSTGSSALGGSCLPAIGSQTWMGV
jgi:hypothetical protein